MFNWVSLGHDGYGEVWFRYDR